jgi:hypothetical protein
MATELFANNPATTLAGGINSAVTTLTVASSTGFPAAATGVSQFRVIIGSELLLVTNVSGTTWTVTRGAESTVAAAHILGAAVTHIVTASNLNELVANARGISVTDPRFGADPTGVSDSTAAIQAAIDYAGSTSTMRAGKVYIPAGDYKVSSTILIDRKNIDLEGAGIGGAGGGGTVLRWDGVAGIPLLRVTKSWATHIHDMRLAGKSTAKPSALISFYNITGDPNGNSHNSLSRLWLGAFEGYDVDDASQMDYGFLIEGDNVNNDQSRFTSLVIHQPNLAGVKVSNTQNLFLHFDDLKVFYSGGDGVQCSGRISGSNWFFTANAGKDLVVDNAGHIRLMDFGSEGSGGLAHINGGDLSIDSGYFQIRSFANGGKFANAAAAAADRRWIDSVTNLNGYLTLIGFDLQQYPGDLSEGILAMKANGGGESKKYITLIRCTGMGTDIAGSTRIDIMVQNTTPDMRVINVIPTDGVPIRNVIRGLPAPFTEYDPSYYHLGDKVKIGNLWLRDNAGTLEKSTTGTGGWSAV